ncbi:hypothetical protein H9P43_000398 [Blastocladiella emersonii ATCC 22665]|nr:hypothetical protein H9P43_000398 [Blastocladiella emersonii ATCC 22665]
MVTVPRGGGTNSPRGRGGGHGDRGRGGGGRGGHNNSSGGRDPGSSSSNNNSNYGGRGGAGGGRGGAGRGRGGRGGSGNTNGNNGQPARLCNAFLAGNCRFGDNCRFSHGHAEDLQVVQAVAACPQFAKFGTCKFGDGCKYSHDPAVCSTSTSGVRTQLKDRLRDLVASPNVVDNVAILYLTAPPVIAMDRVRNPNLAPQYGAAIDNDNAARFLAELLRQLGSTPTELLMELDPASLPLRALLQLAQCTTYSIAAGSSRVPGASMVSFQRVLLPMLYVLAHRNVEQSTLREKTQLLFSAVHPARDNFILQFLACTTEALAQRTLEDRRFVDSPRTKDQFVPHSFAQVFDPFLKFLEQYTMRFADPATKAYVKDVFDMVEPLIDDWAAAIENGVFAAKPFMVESPHAVQFTRMLLASAKRQVLGGGSLKEQMAEQLKLKREAQDRADQLRDDPWPFEQLAPPAHDHDNDDPDFRQISVLPTMDEILCEAPPRLPGNLQLELNAHWLPPGPDRLLDSHFRLLRYDFLAAAKAGVRLFLDTIGRGQHRQESGRFKAVQKGAAADLMVYTDVQPLIEETKFDAKFGIVLGLKFAIPARSMRNQASYVLFWDRCLQWQNMVAVVFPGMAGEGYQVTFATVAERGFDPRDKKSLKPPYPELAHLTLSFGDRDVPPALLSAARANAHAGKWKRHRIYLLEFRGMLFEAYRPILESLQGMTATDLPFPEILCPAVPPTATGEAIELPLYARSPGFRFDLSFLAKPDDPEDGPIYFTPSRDGELDEVTATLARRSKLDESQASALLRALSSNVSCIEGPPGTGKSHVGVNIVEALTKFDADQFPILVICYTNHALDQFLKDLLRVGIKSLVRIGSRPDPDLEAYRPERWSSREFRANLEQLEEKLGEITRELSDAMAKDLSSLDTREAWHALRVVFRSQAQSIASKNFSGSWIRAWLTGHDLKVAEQNARKAANRARKEQAKAAAATAAAARANAYSALADHDDRNEAAAEVDGGDDEFAAALDHLDHLNQAAAAARGLVVAPMDLNAEYDEDALPGPVEVAAPIDVEAALLESRSRALHTGPDRDLAELAAIDDVWSLTLTERATLAEYMHQHLLDEHQRNLRSLRNKSDELRRQVKSMLETRDVQALRNKRIVGMTTTGAAKNQHIMRSLRPKIIICEEAGEVLEAHILAALHRSVHQLILIGDHKQLRPKVNEYELCVGSKRGAAYRFNVSLFERLIIAERPQIPPTLPYVMLQYQRRMKPEISQFIRLGGIYPHLKDGDNTLGRPPVRGMVKDVFFLSHEYHQRSVKEEFASQSHSNEFEADMIVALVEYFLKQGYDHNQLVVLTPYIGQLLLIREKMAGRKLFVAVGERDEDDVMLATGDDGDDQATANNNNGPAIRQIDLRSCIRVACIDNYQGEESDIVLISLVRSTLNDNMEDSGIGFVGIVNRVNVMLSRARMGMYLVGNARLFQAKSDLWTRLVNIMEPKQLIGPVLEIQCQRHPDDVRQVVDADSLRLLAPDGGCNRPCTARLGCGHTCSRKCHADDPDHALARCTRDCARLRDSCRHPCQKLCWEACGPCLEPADDEVTLPGCGHAYRARCHELQDLAAVKCKVKVEKQRFCGHTIAVECSADADLRPCPCQCASETVLGQMVDYVMFETYGEVDLDVSPVLILGCGHVLTVETLDGIVHLDKFYVKLGGAWVRARPPQDYDDEDDEVLKQTPTCPTCRAPIRSADAKRYGRALKRAVVLVNELQQSQVFSAELRQLAADVESFGEFCSNPIDIPVQVPPATRGARGARANPPPPPPSASSVIHKRAMVVTEKIAKFVKALRSDPTRRLHDACWKASTNPDLPPSMVQLIRDTVVVRQFEVEESKAVFLRARVRRHTCEALGREGNLAGARTAFSNALNDLALATKIFEETGALFRVLDISLERLAAYKSLVQVLSKALSKEYGLGAFGGAAEPSPVATALREEIIKLSGRANDLIPQYHALVAQVLPLPRAPNASEFASENLSNEALAERMAAVAAEVENVRDRRREYTDLLQQYTDQFDSFVRAAKDGVSPEALEIAQVILAIPELARIGHWYRCPNGHLYSIGDCGMAMTQSRCPECGATIGGGSHTLLSSNQHAYSVVDEARRVVDRARQVGVRME